MRVQEQENENTKKFELQRVCGGNVVFKELIERLPENSDILNTLYEICKINYVYILKGIELSIYRKLETKKEILRLHNSSNTTEYRDLFLYILEYYNIY
jgi:hypothetical protein